MGKDQSREAESISDIVYGLKDVAQENDNICVRDVIAEFGDRSFAPFMLILSLIGLLPTGGIPGVPTVIAITIILVAGQLVFARKHIWLPDLIAKRSVPAEKLRGANDTLDRIGAKLDEIAKGRLKFLVRGVAPRIVGGIIALLCCLVPALELVPFAAAAPFAAIALLSLSLIVRDGLVMLIAGGLALAALAYGATLVPLP